LAAGTVCCCLMLAVAIAGDCVERDKAAAAGFGLGITGHLAQMAVWPMQLLLLCCCCCCRALAIAALLCSFVPSPLDKVPNAAALASSSSYEKQNKMLLPTGIMGYCTLRCCSRKSGQAFSSPSGPVFRRRRQKSFPHLVPRQCAAKTAKTAAAAAETGDCDSAAAAVLQPLPSTSGTTTLISCSKLFPRFFSSSATGRWCSCTT
jgi:hypothetical protein